MEEIAYTAGPIKDNLYQLTAFEPTTESGQLSKTSRYYMLAGVH